MKKLSFLALLISTTMISSCGSEQNQVKLEFEKYTLANGLEVVLHQDKSDPIVSVAIQYHVGSKDEKPGKTGFAHFFEHMLFQRSENLPRNAFFQKIDALGGSFNGSTGNDGTNYFETVPRDALEKVLWMESDRMGFFINTVTEGGLKREIDVVSNEKRQYENAPYGMAGELIFKGLFPEGHPYSWTVIGELADLRSATIDDVKEFYNKYYTTSNATLVIAGDFDVAQTKQLVEKYFGELAARPKPEKMQPQPATLDAIKNIYYQDSYANAPLLLLEWPGVEMYVEDGYAIDYLTKLLASDKKSPMYKVLVEERKLMPSMDMYNYQMELAGMILVEGTTFPGVKLDDVMDGVKEAFARFERDGIDPKDLERYKLTEETSIYKGLTSTNDKATTMARDNIFTGNPDQSLKDLQRYKAVTADDVMRVYEKYIKGKNYLNIGLVPAGQAELAVTGATEVFVAKDDQQMNSEAGVIVDDPYQRSPSAFDRSVEPEFMANTPQIHLPQVWSSKLDKGMEIKGMAYDELPLVFFSIELNSGMLHDSPEKVGVANLAATMMNEGTALKTPEELQSAIGQLGAKINVYAEKETMTLSGNCLKKNLDQVMSLVEEMLLQPRWDEKVFEVVKERTIDDIRQNATQPNYIGQNALRTLLFGKGNILAANTMGTIESVETITIDDLKDFYANYFSAKSAKMSYVGGHSGQEIEKLARKLTAKWEAIDVPEVIIAPTATEQKAKIYFVDYPESTQSYIIIGNRSMSAADPFAYKALIVNDKLGATAGSVLFEILRLERGYTYGAYSNFAQAKNINYFYASSSVQAAVTKESVTLFKDIISNYGEQYSENYLEKSRSSLIRKMAGAFETPYAKLGMIRTTYVQNRPDNFVELQQEQLNSITIEEAKEVIARYIDFSKMTVVVVGDAKTQFEPLKKLGIGHVVLADKYGSIID